MCCVTMRAELFCMELNLQFVRRNLIQTLEDFEAGDCTRCTFIKCSCEPAGPTPLLSPTDSGQESPSDDGLKPPPATDLPRPDFKTSSETTGPAKDVESWVRASTPNPDKTESPGCKPQLRDLLNFSWPPAPKSVWNDYKNKINRPEINTATVSQANNVQDFFKSFNVNTYCVGTRNAHAQNRALMQKLKFMAVKQSEYSYF